MEDDIPEVDAVAAANEDEEQIIVPVSALEHYSYCPRQCALIHVEQTFDDNVFTTRGNLAHERVDLAEDTVSEGVRHVRSLPLWSERLGLSGKADLVEFHSEGPYPVEYKVGRRRGPHADIQLCAQALCLEEMLGVDVPRGAVYSHATRKRHDVAINAELRKRTVATIEAVREMLRNQEVPAPVDDARCRNCSLIDACLPDVLTNAARLRGLQGALFNVWETDPSETGSWEAGEGGDADA